MTWFEGVTANGPVLHRAGGEQWSWRREGLGAGGL